MWVHQIAVFGSLVDREAVDFGDIDLQVEFANRPAEDLAEAKRAYSRASQRCFSTFWISCSGP
jgi:predicted nucleotidyltransferase